MTIETKAVRIASGSSEHAGAPPGCYVMLAVTDTGTGMDAATKAKIFEPFFTTKGEGKGTGLGLSTVFGIVQQSGGHISVRTEVGAGTTFQVLFPEADASSLTSVSPPSLRAVDRREGKETILLVEDEDGVRKLARTILGREGYTVLEAHNAGEAFLICEQHPKAIDLMLTDVVMPHMNGRKLFERLHPMRPKMKVLYMSGYTDDAIVHEGVLDAGVMLLQKPFTPTGLARRVREVLDASAVDVPLARAS